MKTVAAAWQQYLDDCAQMRELFMRDPIAKKYPHLGASAHFLLMQTQAMAYNQVMAPRQDSPRFISGHLFEPLLYTGHQPNPDFHYQVAFMNGARRWRITGRRNSARWVDIQVYKGWWGEENYCGIGNYDLDDFEISADGSFEIVASAEPEPGNWIRLDPSTRNNVMQLRPALYDWEHERSPQLFIEPLDDGPTGPAVLDEAEIVRRIRLCGEFVKHCIGRWTTRASPKLLKTIGFNQFASYVGEPSRGGANPLAEYGQAVYELAPDEALIIETENPKAPYWGISLGTWWWETTDPTHHHSSVNGHQAHIDGDGRFRAVVSRCDPGVPNWLDTICWDVGIILLRWYRAKQKQAITTTKVHINDVRKHLPLDTPTVTGDERKLQVERRRRAVMRWYGYTIAI